MNRLINVINVIKEYKVFFISTVIAAISIHYGFDSKESIVTSCESTYSKYVIANYSEMETGIDFNGDMYTELNSWSEPASDIFKVTTKDGELDSQSDDFEVVSKGSFYIPSSMPPHDKSMSRERSFDNFSYRSDSNLKVYFYSEDGGYDQFNEPVNSTSLCVAKLKESVIVKTWYSVSYSSDFKEI